MRREALVAGLKAMVPALLEIAKQGDEMGMDREVLNHLRPGIVGQAERLSSLV